MESFRIYIEQVENGYVVEVPDLDEVAEKKKQKGTGNVPVYIGNPTEKYACGTIAEVIEKVRGALAKLPDEEFHDGFKSAVKDKD